MIFVLKFLQTEINVVFDLFFSSMQLEDNHLDKKTYIILQDGQYIINRVITQGEVSYKQRS